MSLPLSSQPQAPPPWVDPEAETVPPRPQGRIAEDAAPGRLFWWALIAGPTLGLLLGVLVGLVAALA